MRTKWIFIILLLTVVTVNAQKNAIIKFDSISHDFGILKEANGPVNTIFDFTNAGTDTLKITEVKTSCSCITVEWPKTPVLSKEKGTVKVIYNPAHFAGPFEKSIWISSNAIERELALAIKGEVIPKPKTLVDSFPVKNGNLLMSVQFFQLRNISNREIKRDSMMIYNAGKAPMSFSFADYPSWVTCRAKPTTLAPHKKGNLYVTYNAAKKNEYGLVYDYFKLVTNDSVNPDKQLTITATITDNFSKLTAAKRENAPKIVFTSSEYADYGTVKEGEIVKQSFEFKNEGKDTLFIRKAIPGLNDCKVTIEGKSALANGESSKLDIEFDTNGKSGNDQRRNAQIVTNDPNRPINIVIITGNVTPK